MAHFLTAKTKLWPTTVDVHMSALRIPVDDLGVVVVKVIGDSLLCQLPAEHGQLGEALTAGLDGHQPVVIHSHQVVTGKKTKIRVLAGLEISLELSLIFWRNSMETFNFSWLPVQ